MKVAVFGWLGEGEGLWVRVRRRDGGDDEQVNGRVAGEGEGQTN